MNKYSSFQAQNKEIKQIIIEQDDILSISSDTLRCHTKGGLLLNSVQDFENLLTFSYQDNQKMKLLISGDTKSMYSFDLSQGIVTDIYTTENGICVTKLGKLLCCGQLNGKISLYDPKNLKKEFTLDVHTGTISDIDIKDNLLVSCGFSLRNNDYVIDNLVKVFDIRMNKLLTQIHFYPGASFVKFNPRVYNQVCLVSQGGFFQFKDIQNDSNNGSLNQLRLSSGELIDSFDISSTGEIISFSDSSGMIHSWTFQDLYRVNNFSVETELPNFPEYTDQYDFSFFQIQEEIDEDGLLSDYKNQKFIHSQPPKEIHPQILTNLKKGKFYNFLNNPGLENLKDGYLNQDNQEELKIIPNQFDKIFIRDLDEKRQKFEKFNYSKFNETKYIGIENQLEDHYINSIIQILYHIKPLRISCMNHFCNRHYCISCELGFLFYIMKQMKQEKSNHKTVNIQNLIRSLKNIKEAKGIGIFQEDDHFIQDIQERTKIFNKFIINQIFKEQILDLYPIEFKSNFKKIYLQNILIKRKSSIIEMLFFFQTVSNIHCSCEFTEKKENLNFLIETTEININNLFFNFEYLKNKICPNCFKPSSLEKSNQVLNLPCILNIQLKKEWKVIPEYLSISQDKQYWKIEPLKEISNSTKSKAIYELSYMIYHIQNPLSQKNGHCITYVKKNHKWVIFNDFQVTIVDHLDIKNWKKPFILFYKRVDFNNLIPKIIYKNPISTYIILNDMKLSQKDIIKNFKQLSKDEIPKKGDLVGMDLECVSLNHSILTVGRISVIREDDNIPFIDDYIATNEEINDYLTRFSGLKLGDLDPNKSKHYVTSLKMSYLKLRSLVDNGIIFIGHGLENDFKIINLYVPKDQIIDTSEIYQLPNQRKISLRYLSFYFLNKDIQSETHDSVEDAKISIELYKYYKNSQNFKDELMNLYEISRVVNWDLEGLKNFLKK